jgi:hypothetical protein
MPSRRLASGLFIVACAALVGCSLDTAPMASTDRATNDDDLGSSGASGFGGTGGMPLPTGGTGGISTLPGTDAGPRPDFGPDGGAGTGDANTSTSDAALDSSTVEPLAAPGAACTTDADCSAAGVERTCISEDALAPLLVLPGGYCSQFCNSGLTCERGATCVLIPLGAFPLLVCMEACSTDAECRVAEGYTCNMAISDTPVCSLP